MHAFEEELEVVRVDPRRNPMSQVRDPRLCLFATLETLARPLNFSLDRFFPSIQYVRIQVALERDTCADGLPSDGRFNTPVQPDHVVTAGLSDIFQRAVRPLREEGERNNRKPLGLQLLPDLCGDVSEGGQRELGEIVRREFTGPRVENLKELKGGGHGP